MLYDYGSTDSEVIHAALDEVRPILNGSDRAT